MSATPKSTADLDWLAFCYVAGELSEEELDQFEARLATDEQACAAVARAVQFGRMVVQGERSAETVIRPALGIRKDLAAVRLPASNLVAVCTVALSLLFVVWMVQQVPSERTADHSQQAVAALWIDGADDGTADEAVPSVAVQAEPLLFDLVEEETVPEWLLAAVNEHQRAVEEGDVIMND